MLKNLNVYAIFFFFSLPFYANSYKTSAITYALNRGRFGDNLITYIKAKWISYKYSIPLLIKSFNYSEELTLNRIEKQYTSDLRKNFTRIIKFEKKSNVKIEKEKPYLYISTYNSNITFDKNDKTFINILKKTIAPQKQYKKHNIPKNRISVALHVRKGGGFDLPLLSSINKKNKKTKYADKCWPLKFPPDEYYIDQIKKICNILNNAPLHIHIFTDDPNPLQILEKYKKSVEHLNITFSCRMEGNKHDKSVLEDFFSMTQYDCLIRSASNFSACADIIGNFLISIYPKNSHWENNKLIIDEVQIQTNLNNHNKDSKFFKNNFLMQEILTT